MSGAVRRRYVLPLGLLARSAREVVPIAFVAMRDAYVPSASVARIGKIGFFGGGVEATDAGPGVTLARELAEETGDWFLRARLAGTTNLVWGLPAQDGFALVAASDDGEVALYLSAVDGGYASWQYLRSACREGAALALPLDRLLSRVDDDFDRPELIGALRRRVDQLVWSW